MNELSPLKGFDGKYMIDRSGNVYGKNKEIPLKSFKKGSGDSEHIVLTVDGKSTHFTIHDLLELQYGSDFMSDWDLLLGYETLYKINKNGDVFSCIYNKIMTPQLSRDGYLKLVLISGENTRKTSIHRLLAIQYIPNPDELPEVDHIDRNKTNNALSNLRWVTHSENMCNRSNSLSLKSEEELEERRISKREYNTMKAREYRERDKDKPKPSKSEEEIVALREYKKLKAREYYAKKKAAVADEDA